MNTITLSISGMSCGHCVGAVRKAIEAVAGAEVRDVQVGSADVSLGEGTAPATVIAAVRDAGYDVVAPTARISGHR